MDVTIPEKPESNIIDIDDPTPDHISKLEESPMLKEESMDNLLAQMDSIGRHAGPTHGKGRSNGTAGRGERIGKFIAGQPDNKKIFDAVMFALAWLAHHQEEDGSWQANKYDGKNREHFNATALALLPFLGAGISENIGQYKTTVRKGIRWLNQEIQNKGKSKPHFGNNYGSAIGLTALSEAALFGSSATTRRHANRLAKMFLNMHQNENSGGWNYKTGGQDFSVSGWVAVGLKSAYLSKLSSMKTPSSQSVLKSYRNWVNEKMTDASSGMGRYRPERDGNRNMTWVGMFQKYFLGAPANDPFLVKAVDNSLNLGWSDEVLSGNKIKDAYAMYYGAMASHQAGGQFWKTWERRMPPFVVGHQQPGDPRELGGSWDPGKCRIGVHGGRVMMTAMMALTLEVFWRFDRDDELIKS